MTIDPRKWQTREQIRAGSKKEKEGKRGQNYFPGRKSEKGHPA
jgi:hypothetical protein